MTVEGIKEDVKYAIDHGREPSWEQLIEYCEWLITDVERLQAIEKLERMESEALSDTLKRAETAEAEVKRLKEVV